MSYTFAAYQSTPPPPCSGGPRPGIKAFMAYMMDRFGWTSMGIYNCRPPSRHAAGAAWDQGIPVGPGGTARPELGMQAIDLVLRHGKRLGVTLAIYNRQKWGAAYPDGKYYGGRHPHFDHIHWDFTNAAAENLTYATLVAVLGPVTGDGTPDVGYRPVLREGMTGPYVRELQGLIKVTVDGVFGPDTKSAVIEFQDRHDLEVDGIVGAETWAALKGGPPPKPEPELKTSRITKIELRKQYQEASARWPFFHQTEQSFGLPRYLLFAVGSRETGLQEKYTKGATGDGGHGHGVFQLDDRWHTIPPGFDTDASAQARKAAEMLSDGIKRHGLLGGLNYYNSGKTATSATTGKDYGPDVIARMEYLQAVFDSAGKEDDDVIRIIKTTNYDGSAHDGVFIEANFSTVKWVPNRMIWEFAEKYAVAGGPPDGPILVRRDEFDTLQRIGNAPAIVWPK